MNHSQVGPFFVSAKTAVLSKLHHHRVQAKCFGQLVVGFHLVASIKCWISRATLSVIEHGPFIDDLLIKNEEYLKHMIFHCYVSLLENNPV